MMSNGIKLRLGLVSVACHRRDRRRMPASASANAAVEADTHVNDAHRRAALALSTPPPLVRLGGGDPRRAESIGMPPVAIIAS